MNISRQIFKACDIRGIYPSELDEEGISKIGQAVTQLLNAKKIVIGRDMRLSSPALFESLKNGLLEMGIEIIDIGLCSTTMSYFANIYCKTDASIMITASHNPSNYNGLKICGPEAQYITTFIKTTDIEDLIKTNGIKTSNFNGQITKVDILDQYVNKITENVKIDPQKIGKIVVDVGNGIEGMVISSLLSQLKIDYIPLYFESDGSFPNHEPNPLKTESLKVLQKEVLKQNASLGISFDGDGDRIGFVDEKGEVINGDLITIIIAKEILKTNAGSTIMYDLRSTWAVKEEIISSGGKPEMCVVGHGLIKPIMRKNNVIFAGELSNHYYFKDLNYTDNADMALVQILSFLSGNGQKISLVTKPFKRYFHTGEINFEVENPKLKIEEISEKIQDGNKFTLDGLSVEFDNWWFNLRPSNNEPLLRLNLEAKTNDLMEEKKNYLISLIGKEPSLN
ncbi:MAG: phosphomannomutase/phosphoglucomutase [Patescibacteria group bacterium]|jgi:phosphomannomutase